MLSELFESAARIHGLRAGPAGAELDEFAHMLSEVGYAQITARRHLRAAEHFVHWADRRHIPVTGAIGPTLDRFGRHLQRACRCPHFGHTFRVQILHGARVDEDTDRCGLRLKHRGLGGHGHGFLQRGKLQLHVDAERFEARPVRMQPVDATRFVVAAGLSEGERLVVRGADLINQIR